MPWSFVPREWNNWSNLIAAGAEQNGVRHAHLVYLHQGSLIHMHTDEEPVFLPDGRMLMRLPDEIDVPSGGSERHMVVVTRDCLSADWVIRQLDTATSGDVPWWTPATAPSTQTPQ